MSRFDEMSPVLEGSFSEFSVEMVGPGRWFVMSEDNEMFGVLWTDDKEALGLMGTEKTSSYRQQVGWAEIRRSRANGRSATETFDLLLSEYPSDAYGEGDLGLLRGAF